MIMKVSLSKIQSLLDGIGSPLLLAFRYDLNFYRSLNRNINKVIALSNKRFGTSEVQFMDVTIF